MPIAGAQALAHESCGAGNPALILWKQKGWTATGLGVITTRTLLDGGGGEAPGGGEALSCGE